MKDKNKNMINFVLEACSLKIQYGLEPAKIKNKVEEPKGLPIHQ